MDLGFSRSLKTQSRNKKQGAFALFAGVSLFVAGLSTFSLVDSGTPVQVKLSSFDWLASMKLELAQPLPAIEIKPEAPVVFAPLPETQKSLAVAPPKAKHRSRARHIARSVALQDAIRTAAAAAVEPEYVDGLATQSQLTKFQGMNTLLRQQFFAGVEGRILEQPTQFAVTDADLTLASAIEYSAPKAHSKHKAPKKQTQNKVDTQTSVAQTEAAPLPAAPLPNPKPTFYQQLAQANLKGATTVAATAYDAPIGPEPLAIEVTRRPAVLNTQGDDLRDQISRAQAQAEAAPYNNDESQAGGSPGGTLEVVGLQGDEASAGQSSDDDASGRRPADVNTQVTFYGGNLQAAMTNLAKAGSQSPASAPGPNGYPPVNTQVVDWPKRTVIPTGLVADMAKVSNSRGWKVGSDKDSWPTVVDAASPEAPVVSNNTALMLAHRQNVALQADTGMVIGKLPAGWSVKISGRAERPVFLSADHQFVGNEVVYGDRDFIFLNTAPGTQILSLVGPNGIDGGVVTIPVINHTASYVDFTRQQRKPLTGVLVYGDTCRNGVPCELIANAKVSVMGQPGATTWSNENGEFSIPQVLAVGNLPIHIDVERQETRAGGKAHVQRFRVYGNAMENVPLYMVREKGQVRVWVDQLLDEVNSETGMIVGAFSDFGQAAATTGAKYRPVIEPFAFNAGLPPETYVVSDEGQLQVNTPLGAKDNVFMGLQISEGPVMAKILESGKSSAWSDVVYAEPNTVNVIYNTP